jgi:hypothetical protein
MRLRHVSESEPSAKAREAFSGEFDHQLTRCGFSVRAGIQVHLVTGTSEAVRAPCVVTTELFNTVLQV